MLFSPDHSIKWYWAKNSNLKIYKSKISISIHQCFGWKIMLFKEINIHSATSTIILVRWSQSNYVKVDKKFQWPKKTNKNLLKNIHFLLCEILLMLRLRNFWKDFMRYCLNSISVSLKLINWSYLCLECLQSISKI